MDSEYIATGNQWGEIRGNEKVIWQKKESEIVVLLYLFGN
jgi:hypothetical protein